MPRFLDLHHRTNRRPHRRTPCRLALAALGGLNPLIAYANPVFSEVPQIMAARTHPDPALLKETLQDLVEAFEAGAGKSGASDATVEGAVYALCCLADDAAATTPWGKDWAA